LLTLRWPFGQYVLCLYFYVIACTSMPLLVDKLNKYRPKYKYKVSDK